MYDGSKERNSEYEQGHAAKTMTFKGRPQAGASRSHARADQGGAYEGNSRITGYQKSERKLLSPVTPNAQSTVASIYRCVYIYVYLYIYIYSYVYANIYMYNTYIYI